jgi:hypothetical protein
MSEATRAGAAHEADADPVYKAPRGLPAFDVSWLRPDSRHGEDAGRALLEEMRRPVAMAALRKLMWVDMDERGDIPPVIIVLGERGQLLAEVTATQIDHHLGFHAMRVLRAGFDADGLVAVFDAHRAEALPGETPEDMRRKWGKPGSMQKACDDEGACDAGLLTDCLLVYRAWRSGRVCLATLPYAYHGKGGPPFRWAGPGEHTLAQDAGDGSFMQGGNVEAVRRIMATPAIIDHPVTQAAASLMGLGEPGQLREKKLYHTARAALACLAGQGFIVLASQEMGDAEGMAELAAGARGGDAPQGGTPRERADARRRKKR